MHTKINSILIVSSKIEIKSYVKVWIEKLLETPIADHRHFCLWHILIPYLVNVKGLSEHEMISIITDWLDRCSQLNKVRWKYPQRIKEQLK